MFWIHLHGTHQSTILLDGFDVQALTPTLPPMKFNETCKLTFPENVP